MALTPKQQRFVDEYLIDLNATAAAERAGYKQSHVQGPRLLANVSVAEAIQSRKQKRAERTALTQDEVIDGLRDEAKFSGDGAQHSARVKAWELLGKHLGMLVDKHEHSGPNGGPVQLLIEEIVVTSTVPTNQEASQASPGSA